MQINDHTSGSDSAMCRHSLHTCRMFMGGMSLGKVSCERSYTQVPSRLVESSRSKMAHRKMLARISGIIQRNAWAARRSKKALSNTPYSVIRELILCLTTSNGSRCPALWNASYSFVHDTMCLLIAAKDFLSSSNRSFSRQTTSGGPGGHGAHDTFLKSFVSV